jgi:hypothetical protein
MTVAIPTPNTEAARRRDKPPSTPEQHAPAKFGEYGRAKHAGPIPASSLNHILTVAGIRYTYSVVPDLALACFTR